MYIRISVEFTTLLESRVLADNEAVEDAKNHTQNTNNGIQNVNPLVAVSLTKYHAHSAIPWFIQHKSLQ